ncbi:YajG family lipoprotein [uncultured Tistrella sp.]|uniref:YajG family lipoprotein n=1 Tax=Tistrella mobilis TaxID=171437 RepID=UPI002630F9C8|nr:YajG family lipoprotein [uncultured Tistrella sp.]
MKKLITVALGLLMLSACAFTEDSIPVHYTAPANLELVQGASDVTLEVVGQDGRVANRDRISSKKNGYGMETARILAANDVVAEVANAVRTELQSLGFTIGEGGIHVVIETQTFYNDFKTGFWSGDAVAEVAFMLTATKPDGTLVYSRAYRAVGMNKDIMMASAENAAPALEEALREAVRQVVQDKALHAALLAAR